MSLHWFLQQQLTSLHTMEVFSFFFCRLPRGSLDPDISQVFRHRHICNNKILFCMLVKVLTEEQTSKKMLSYRKANPQHKPQPTVIQLTSANNDLQSFYGHYSSLHTSFVQDLSRHHNQFSGSDDPFQVLFSFHKLSSSLFVTDKPTKCYLKQRRRKKKKRKTEGQMHGCNYCIPPQGNARPLPTEEWTM